MSTDQYSFQIEDTQIRSYALDANELYDYPAMKTIQPLRTCPLTSEMKVVAAPWSSGNQFVFDTNFGKNQFVSNSIRFDFTVPLKVTLTAEAATDITAANFMTTVFGADQGDICYSQYSFLQTLNSMSIDLNSRNVLNMANISDSINQVAPYYRKSDINEYFHASQPDRYQSFEDYTGNSGQKIGYIDHLSNSVMTTVNPLNESNIFGSKYAEGYCSRTPVWTFISAGTGTGPGSDARKICYLKSSFWIYLPLTFGSVPDKMTAFSGISRMAVTFGLKADLGSFLFNIKQQGGAFRYANIELNTSGINDKTAGQMMVQVYSAPQFMRDSMVNSATGLMQPYSIACPRIITTTGNTYAVNASADQQFNISNVQSGVVPRDIYISLQKVKKGAFQTCSSTPINYGMITNLSINVSGAVTNFPSLLSLCHLSDTNGYDELDMTGRLMKGFPLRLDVGKDLSLPEDVVIGQAYNFNCEITGSFKNQSLATAEYKLLVTVVTDSTIDFDGDGFSVSSGAVIDNSVLSDKHFLRNQYSIYQRKVNVLGGGIFGDAAKWVGRNGLKLAKSAWENREKIAKTVGDVMGLVKTVRGGSSVAYSNVSGGGRPQTMGAGKTRQTVFK